MMMHSRDADDMMLLMLRADLCMVLQVHIHDDDDDDDWDATTIPAGFIK